MECIVMTLSSLLRVWWSPSQAPAALVPCYRSDSSSDFAYSAYFSATTLSFFIFCRLLFVLPPFAFLSLHFLPFFCFFTSASSFITAAYFPVIFSSFVWSSYFPFYIFISWYASSSLSLLFCHCLSLTILSLFFDSFFFTSSIDRLPLSKSFSSFFLRVVYSSVSPLFLLNNTILVSSVFFPFLSWRGKIKEPAYGIQHTNYKIGIIWMHCLTFSYIPRNLPGRSGREKKKSGTQNNFQ